MRSTLPLRPSPSSHDLSPSEFAAVDGAFFGALKPPERITVSEWADKYRIVSGKEAAEPGRWRTSRTPYLREIMDALSPASTVENVTLMFGAQLGKTECGNNWIGSTIDQAPSAMLIVWRDLPEAKKNSNLRIKPMIQATESLRKKVRSARERDSGNTILSKEFPGGILLITGANSSSGLRSTPAGKLFADEVDAWPADVDGEGDPLELAIVRTRNFNRRKILITSTPTSEVKSRIAEKFADGDQRYYHVPCPHCGVFQALKWAQLRWDEGKPETVRYYCIACAAGIEEGGHKTAMLAAGKWVPTNPSAPAWNRSYHLSSLYSPLPWYRWERMVRDFLKAKDAPEGKLKVFANTVWAETWKETGEVPEWEVLFNRRENYMLGVVPRRGLIITAGADVQRDRIEVELVAWGRRLESWTVGYFIFKGDTELDSTWEPLAELLASSFPHESGARLPIRMAAVDASFNQNRVLSWIRTQPTTRTMAVKGRGNYPQSIGAPATVDIDYQGRKVYRGATLWPVGVSVLKRELYEWLRIGQPTDPEKGYPAGYCHFSMMLPEEHFRQLCAERLVKKKKKGYIVREWEKTRERNEALDCRVYARAAAVVLGLDVLSTAQWTRLERALGMDPSRPPRQAGGAPAEKPAEPPPRDSPATAPERPPLPGPEFWSGWHSPKPS